MVRVFGRRPKTEHGRRLQRELAYGRGTRGETAKVRKERYKRLKKSRSK